MENRKNLQINDVRTEDFAEAARTVTNLVKNCLPSAEIVWMFDQKPVSDVDLRRKQREYYARRWCETVRQAEEKGVILAVFLKNLPVLYEAGYTDDQIRQFAEQTASLALYALQIRERYFEAAIKCETE